MKYYDKLVLEWFIFVKKIIIKKVIGILYIVIMHNRHKFVNWINLLIVLRIPLLHITHTYLLIEFDKWLNLLIVFHTWLLQIRLTFINLYTVIIHNRHTLIEFHTP